jgi:hypothetical protein
VNQEQRERLAGIASRMRTRATVLAGGRAYTYDSLCGFAAEIEACIAEPAAPQPAPTVELEAHP